MGSQEVLDLNGVDVFPTGDDNVLLTVNQEDETVFVFLRHIAGEEPTVSQNFGSCLGVVVVASHQAGAANGQFTHVTARHIAAVFVHDTGFPTVPCLTDGANLVDVFHAQMDAARSDGFGKAVVGIVLMTGELFLPATDQAGRYRLRTNVHQSPLIQLIAAQINVTAVDGIQHILCPGNQEPYDGTFFLGYRIQDRFRLCSLQQDTLSAHQEAAEPVHLCPGVVQRRDTEEHVILGLMMVSLFCTAGMQ